MDEMKSSSCCLCFFLFDAGFGAGAWVFWVMHHAVVLPACLVDVPQIELIVTRLSK